MTDHQKTFGPEDHFAPRSAFDFQRIYHALLDKLWLIAICLVVALLLAAAYLHRAPRLFASTATLMVEQGDQKVVNIQKVQQEDLRGLEVLRTIEQILKSRSLLERVVVANALDKDPRFVPLGMSATPAQIAIRLEGMVDVRLRRFTRLIDVTAVHTDPKVAALIPNSLIKEYMKQNLELYSSASQGASEFLLEEAGRLKKKLEQSEQALHAYREKTKSISLEQKQDIVNPKLKELSQRLTEAKSKRMDWEGKLAQVKGLGTNVQSLLVLPAVAGDLGIMNIQASIVLADSNFAKVRQRYKAKHPNYLQAASQLEDLKNSLSDAVKKIAQTVQASYDSALVAEKELEKGVQEQTAVALDLNAQMIDYNVLAREVESDKLFYDAVNSRLKETSLTKDLPSNPVRLVQGATAANAPFSPNQKKILLMGALAGLMGGIFLVLGLNALDRSVKTVDQAEESLGLTVLSAIPEIKDFKKDESSLVVAEDAKSIGAEAFRSLRTSLRMLGREEDRRTFLFTSALPSEGKTFCAANYALSLAQQGLRVVLIDGDLRRPTVEKVILGKSGHGGGVSDYLTGQKKLSEIVQPTGHEKFLFISAGTVAPNPAELLAQRNFDSLVDEALVEFDRVVVDSAPIHAVSDTLVMLNKIQTVCVVVRAGKTPAGAAVRAIQMLQKSHSLPAGIILNRLPRRRGTAGYDPYYDYSFKDQYGVKGVYGAK
ncbi:MAG: polysaccharide biosynthesis tyrosine autokinase [Verrucomicrobiota bacterium]